MFTGIIEEIGRISSVRKMKDGFRFTIDAIQIPADIKIDDSVNIDGACQTVVHQTEHSFSVEAVGETITKSTLGSLNQGRLVNLERSLTLQTRLGGHMVQGHVNGIGKITQWYPRGENYYLEILLPQNLTRYCIREGSIAIDGISLTIANLRDNRIGLSIIPHTVNKTTLQYRKTEDLVNIEVDVIARYVENFINNRNKNGLTEEKLKNWGY